MIKRAQSGFTFIEVLISLAILAFVLAALTRMEISSIALAAKNNLSIRATAAAVTELDLLIDSDFISSTDKEVEKELKNSETEELTGFSYNAIKKDTTYTQIPVTELELKVKYEGIDYAVLKAFQIRAL